MNPAYFQTRFRADLPHGGLPRSFCIVTACNPDGKTTSPEANAAATSLLRAMIEKFGWPHFPVTGGSADFNHAEPGFGIITELDDGIALARTFKQEALFFVERGRVSLYEASSDAGGPCWGLKSWAEMTEGTAAHPDFHFSGSPALLDLPTTAFFCSTECPGDAVLKAYAWAQRQCDEEFPTDHTPLMKPLIRPSLTGLASMSQNLPRKICLADFCGLRLGLTLVKMVDHDVCNASSFHLFRLKCHPIISRHRIALLNWLWAADISDR